MLQIVTAFRGLTETPQTSSGVVNTWHGAIIAISIVTLTITSRVTLIEKLSRVHNILRIEYFLYRFHIGDLCSTA